MANSKPETENMKPKTVVIYGQVTRKEFAARKKKDLKLGAKYVGAAVKAVFVDVIPARTEWEKAQAYCKKHGIDYFLIQKSDQPNEVADGYIRMTEEDKLSTVPEVFPDISYEVLGKLKDEQKAAK